MPRTLQEITDSIRELQAAVERVSSNTAEEGASQAPLVPYRVFALSVSLLAELAGQTRRLESRLKMVEGRAS